MKKFKFALLTFMTALISLGFTACSDDDDLKNVSVTGVTITPTTLTLKAGTTGTLTATVVPENAAVTTVAWSSSDTNIATIENGIVTAISEGSTTIKVKTDDGGFTATCEVTVTNDAPAFDESKYHFDLFLTVGKHGGMSSKNTTVVNSVNKLTADMGTITVKGEGTELGDYSMESISKGKYYYQIPSSNDRFVKYQIKDNKVIECASSPFKTNTYKVRSYTHAWIDDNTLVVMAANGDASKVIWSKLNTDNMSILAEGTLDVEKFRFYMIQDYRYLLQYAKVFAFGVIKTEDPELMRRFAGMVHDVLDGEMNVHKTYMARLGITEEEVAKTPSALTNQSYTSYMLDVANKGGPLEILMAVLACAWSYQVIGEHHVKVPGAVEHPLYGEWVQGYSSKEYADSTKEIIDCVDALGENITPEQEAYLTDIFVKCSRYEKLFWDMAYAMEM